MKLKIGFLIENSLSKFKREKGEKEYILPSNEAKSSIS